MSLRQKLLLFILLFCMFDLQDCSVHHDETIQKQLFDLNWKFNLGNPVFAEDVNLIDNNWRNIDLPHDWSKDKELNNSFPDNFPGANSMEIGWYRKHFEIPKNWVDKSILIDFEGICDRSELFINGIMLDNSKVEKDSYQIILNPYLNFEGENVIAIRVVIPRTSKGTWKEDSGINKHVWLLVRASPEFSK